jgi:hypothetical protein
MGFVSPPRSHIHPHHPGDAIPESALPPSRSSSSVRPVPPPWRQAASTSSRRDPSVGSPCSPVAEAADETDGAGGRSRVSRDAFSAPAREPFAAPWTPPATEVALGDRGSASEVCPDSVVVTRLSAMPPSVRLPPEGVRFSQGSPAGLITDLHGVFQRQRTLRGAPPRLAVRLGARPSEECRLPGPVWAWGPAPSRRWALAGVEPGCRPSEEVRFPCPDGVRGLRLRRASGSLSRGMGGPWLRRAAGSLSR